MKVKSTGKARTSSGQARTQMTRKIRKPQRRRPKAHSRSLWSITKRRFSKSSESKNFSNIIFESFCTKKQRPNRNCNYRLHKSSTREVFINGSDSKSLYQTLIHLQFHEDDITTRVARRLKFTANSQLIKNNFYLLSIIQGLTLSKECRLFDSREKLRTLVVVCHISTNTYFHAGFKKTTNCHGFVYAHSIHH